MQALIIAPITTTIRNYLWRVKCSIVNKNGEIAVDQLKVVGKTLIGSKVSKLSEKEISELKEVLSKREVN